jgi:hypothetical protein
VFRAKKLVTARSKKITVKVAYLCNLKRNFVNLTFKIRDKKTLWGGRMLKKYKNYFKIYHNINLDLSYINKNKNIVVYSVFFSFFSDILLLFSLINCLICLIEC